MTKNNYIIFCVARSKKRRKQGVAAVSSERSEVRKQAPAAVSSERSEVRKQGVAAVSSEVENKPR